MVARTGGSFVLLLAIALGAPAEGAESVDTSLTVRATVSFRTSLMVSAEVLTFDRAAPGQPATAAIAFSAGARTAAGAEVMLSVEMTGAADADLVDRALTFEGYGEGTSRGDISQPGPKIAGRWSGSGLRRGTLVFVLRSSQTGAFRVPVRFVLSAP
jgi:hypothetical protein